MKCPTNEERIIDDRIVSLYSFTADFLPTARKTRLEDYNKLFKYWKKGNFTVLVCHYELNTRGRLHIHGIAQSRPNAWIRRLHKKYYSIKIDALDSEKDLKKWVKYIEKDYSNRYEEEQFLQTYDLQASLYPFLESRKTNIGRNIRVDCT